MERRQVLEHNRLLGNASGRGRARAITCLAPIQCRTRVHTIHSSLIGNWCLAEWRPEERQLSAYHTASGPTGRALTWMACLFRTVPFA